MITSCQNSPYYGCGSLTREQFLFFEMRITARLMVSGLSDADITACILRDNLYQYPTEKLIRSKVGTCLKRIKALDSAALIETIANGAMEEAKQICLYAIMRQNYLVCDFMLRVIGEKYRQLDLAFSRRDLNTFFLQIQEQDETVASWSDATVSKIKSVFMKILVETGYLESNNSDRLNSVLLYPSIAEVFLANGDRHMLPAFNCFD